MRIPLSPQAIFLSVAISVTIALVSSASVPAQSKVVSEQDGFPKELIEGVSAIGSPGTPGGLSVFGESAWPIVVGNGVGVVAAAEREGGKAGRLIAFTQEAFLHPDVFGQADTEDFIRNAGRWLCGGGKRSTWANVGGGECKLGEALNMRAAEDWQDADVLVAAPGSLTPARLEKVRAHLANGGGVLIGCTPWGWQQVTPDLRLSRDLTLNRLMEPFGVVYNHAMAGDTGPDSFVVGAPPSRWTHADQAFRALSLEELSGDNEELAKRTLKEAVKALSDFEPTLMMPMRDFAARGESEFAKELAGWLQAEEGRRGLRPVHERWGAWQMIGPFSSGRRGKELENELKIEDEIPGWRGGSSGPDYLKEWKGAKGKVGWHQVELEVDGRDLDVGELAVDQHLALGLEGKQTPEGWSDRTSALLYRRIVIGPEVGSNGVSYAMKIQADGGLRVWLDGSLVTQVIPLVNGGAEGTVAMPEARFTLSLSPGVHHLVVKLVHTATRWRFRASGGEGLNQMAVNAAIDRGVDYLISQQYLDGSWPGYSGYGVGLSALNLFALAESGLPRDHPAIRRALSYLDAHPAKHVYSLGCEMLARAQLDRGDQVEILRHEAELMASWEERTGLYAYPIHPNGSFLPEDVSNTLFAALALSAASRRGIEVDPETWLGMIKGTLQCMEREKSGATGRPPLGFAYRPSGTSTGSMTTAALTILLSAQTALDGRLKGRQRDEIAYAVDRGLSWVDANMTLEKDPGGGWHFFYLYGIERLGSLLGTEVLGGISWYDSGAEYLMKVQEANGKWTSQSGDVDTALALLFLNRATAPVSGDERAVEWRLLSADGDLSVRGKIGTSLEVWLTGIDEGVREANGLDSDTSLEIQSVDWVARSDGKESVLATVSSGGAAERFAAALAPDFPSAFELFARATVSVVGGEGPPIELESGPLQVPALYTDGELAYGGDDIRNLLRGASADASSSRSKPEDALDGDLSTNWICEESDRDPTWSADLTSPVDADTLLLTHRGPRPEHQGLSRVTRVRVVINGTQTVELDMTRELMKKTVVDLGGIVKVRRVQVQLLGFTGDGNSGFSEVELVLNRR